MRDPVWRRWCARPVAVVLVEASVLAFILFVRAPSPALGSEPGKPARAVVERTAIDLGIRGKGDGAVANFVVRNAGAEPLEIEVGQVTPSTPAVRTEVHGAPVAPGKDATIVASIDTDAITGSATFRIPVTTNDPQAADLSLRLSVNVRPALIASPPAVRYALLEGDPAQTVVLTVSTSDGASFRVLRIDPTTTGVEATFAEAKPEERREGVSGSQWRIVATLPSTAAKAGSGKLLVVTDHPKQKELAVPVNGFMTPLLSSLPAAAILSPDPAGQITPFTIHLMSVRDVTIQRVETTVPGLAVDLASTKPARSFKLRVSSKEPLGNGPLDGTIDVTTDGEHPITFRIPVQRVAPPPPGSDLPGL
ncbi:MAG: DUF1573 domain-containing protein [Gemmatimonadetes bacterium]|nr:DUF1573 domain-containing protein [Gemmatimonadota bacterium]